MTPRSLNARVTLQSPPTGTDAAGDPSGSWTTVATVGADIRHPGGLEAIRAGADTSVVKASIRIRHRTGMTAGWRVVFGTQIYDVKAVLPDARKRHLDLLCEVVS